MIPLREIPLFPENFLEERSKKQFRALSTVVRYEKDSEGNNTDAVKDCGIICRVVGGFRQTFYFPKTSLNDVQKLKDMIDSGAIVYIKLIKFSGSLFAYESAPHTVLAGPLTKAAGFEIVSSEEPDIEDFDDDSVTI